MKKLILIITSIMFSIGFSISYMLIKVNTNYDIGASLGFLLGIFECLLIFNLLILFPSKNKEKDTKAINLLTKLALTNDTKMCNELFKRYLTKLKNIYKV